MLPLVSVFSVPLPKDRKFIVRHLLDVMCD